MKVIYNDQEAAIVFNFSEFPLACAVLEALAVTFPEIKEDVDKTITAINRGDNPLQ